MSEQTLDYFTCVMSVLNDDGLLLSKQIDTSDSTYASWKAGTLSPRDYLKYCISKQWIDITKLDVDQNMELAQQFRVMSIPTLIIFKNGAEAHRLVGLTDKEELKKLLDE